MSERERGAGAGGSTLEVWANITFYLVCLPAGQASLTLVSEVDWMYPIEN